MKALIFRGKNIINQFSRPKILSQSASDTGISANIRSTILSVKRFNIFHKVSSTLTFGFCQRLTQVKFTDAEVKKIRFSATHFTYTCPCLATAVAVKLKTNSRLFDSSNITKRNEKGHWPEMENLRKVYDSHTDKQRELAIVSAKS